MWKIRSTHNAGVSKDRGSSINVTMYCKCEGFDKGFCKSSIRAYRV